MKQVVSTGSSQLFGHKCWVLVSFFFFFFNGWQEEGQQTLFCSSSAVFPHVSCHRKHVVDQWRPAWIPFNISKRLWVSDTDRLGLLISTGHFSLSDEGNQTWRWIRDGESLNLHPDGSEAAVCGVFYAICSAAPSIKHGMRDFGETHSVLCTTSEKLMSCGC